MRTIVLNIIERSFYLSLDNTLIILTNVKDAFFFNREALIDYKPFASIPFIKIIEDYQIYGNIWETVRRIEDDIPKINLDKEFFESLKIWFGYLSTVEYIENNKFSNEELTVLFLNKFIFIKTLEDFGLVEYKFIQSQYESYVKKWEPKGYEKVFSYFFNELEHFFEDYYNTELFTSNYWDYVEKSDENIRRFKEKFEIILGLDTWAFTYGKGLVHFNYRHINEDVFGKAYETWIAENRKDEGIFYTPAPLTEYMTMRLVDSLFDEPIEQLKKEFVKDNPNYAQIESLMNDIRNIKIIDPASGSGSFLIKVFRRIFEKYMLIEEATKWAVNYHPEDIFTKPKNIQFTEDFRTRNFFNGQSKLQLISSIILNHIFAADIDERALETAKTNLWKEAIKLDPQSYNYLKLDKTKLHILPNLELNFVCGDSLVDIEFEQQIDIIKSEFKNEIIRLFEIRNEYLINPFHTELIKEASEIKVKLRNRLKKELTMFEPLFFCAEFIFCYFNKNGELLDESERGFSGVISNPPWEAIKPVKKEFSRQKKYERDILNFNDWFEKKLKKDKEFKFNWDNYVKNYENYTGYLYHKYKYQSTGDPNFYKFFIERNFQLLKSGKHLCLLVPSGFQTDEGSNHLRDFILNNNQLIELSSFENKGYYDEEISENHKIKLFPEVDPRYKYSIILANKVIKSDYFFKAKFYLQDPKELLNNNFLEYDIEKIKRFSPENISIMEFQSDRDYLLCDKILNGNVLLADTEFKLRTEFHMTNDSNLYHSLKQLKEHKGEKFCRLYEGKMIHQFNSNFGIPRYFINEEEGRKKLLGKVIYRIKRENELSNGDFEKIKVPDDLLLDYETYRFVYRAVGSSTNERSIICSIVPPKVFVGHSMNHIVNVDYKIKNNIIESIPPDNKTLIYIMSLLNSLSLNYYMRNKISANLTMNFVYELPIAEANEQEKKRIVELGFNLLYRKSNKADFEDLKNELNINVDESKDLIEMRAELEVLIAKNLYGLDKNDWDYLTSTFTYGGESVTKNELDRFIEKSKEMW